MPIKHGRKHKSTRSKQNSEKSNKSDRTSESEPDKQTLEMDQNPNHEYIEGYHNDIDKDRNEYQKAFANSSFRQTGTDGIYQTAPLPIETSTYQAHGGFPNSSLQSGYSPQSHSNVPSKIATSQASPINPHTKPRVVIKDPVPYYKTPNPANDIPYPGPTAEYGREIAETLRVRIIQVTESFEIL